MLDHDTDAPFKWLQCVEEPQLAFVILDPAFFKPDYQHRGLIGCAHRNSKAGQR
jgi:flagellar assembly factor FliW